MLAIECDNPSLEGVLPKDHPHPRLDKQRLGQLIDLIGNIGLGLRRTAPETSWAGYTSTSLQVRQRRGQEQRPVLLERSQPDQDHSDSGATGPASCLTRPTMLDGTVHE